MEIIERFATELRLTGKSAHTIRAYSSDVRRLLKTVAQKLFKTKGRNSIVINPFL